MKAVEAVKEKFYCFLGIVHPTYYQSRGWGPWLGKATQTETALSPFPKCLPHSKASKAIGQHFFDHRWFSLIRIDVRWPSMVFIFIDSRGSPLVFHWFS